MSHIQGGKIGGSHTTTNELGAIMAHYADKLPGVTKVTLGYLQQMSSRKESNWSVKIVNDQACLLLLCLQKATKQEVRIYTERSHRQVVLESLARFTRNQGYELRFKKQ